MCNAKVNRKKKTNKKEEIFVLQHTFQIESFIFEIHPNCVSICCFEKIIVAIAYQQTAFPVGKKHRSRTRKQIVSFDLDRKWGFLKNDHQIKFRYRHCVCTYPTPDSPTKPTFHFNSLPKKRNVRLDDRQKGRQGVSPFFQIAGCHLLIFFQFDADADDDDDNIDIKKS